ncbi:MAG: KaiC domain-containing protein, partial [Halobacteriaceae archaeon]
WRWLIMADDGEEDEEGEEEDWFESAIGGEEPEAEGEKTDTSEEAQGETTAEEEQAESGGEPKPGEEETEGEEELFSESFSDEFEGGGGDLGMNERGMGEQSGFGQEGPDTGFEADEEFESEIPRLQLGIEGLDAMIQGGVPKRSLIVTIGAAGTGKTTFGLQFLEEGITEHDQRGVFITLEESHDRIVTSAEEKGWDFEQYIEDGDLAVVDLDPIEMANSLESIRDELSTLVENFGADRLVLDSVSLLEMMYDDQASRRTEIYDFTKSLKRAGVTTMLTSEASESSPHNSRFGIIEYLTDAVFVLRYVRPDDFRETRLAVEIQKIRDANHSRETKPYEITNEGISVYRQANIF